IFIAIGMLNFIQKTSNMRELLISIVANVCVFSFWGMGMAFYFNFIGMQGNYAHLLLVFLAVVLMALIMSGFVVLVYGVSKSVIETAG
ncbi:ABC transporter permease, partial [Helicobacter pylori]